MLIRFFYKVLVFTWWLVTLTIIVWWFLFGAFLILDALVIFGLLMSNNYDLLERMINLVLPLLGITLGIFGILRLQLMCHPARFRK